MAAMKVLTALSMAGSLKGIGATLSETGPFPATYAAFSSAFVQPAIPTVVVDFRGHFIQHKW